MNSIRFVIIGIIMSCSTSALADPGFTLPGKTGIPNAFAVMSSSRPQSFPLPRDSRKPRYAEGHILVKFKEKTSEHAIASAHALIRGSSTKQFKVVRGLHLVKVPPETPIEKALQSYRVNNDVLYAEPDYKVTALSVPNDSYFGLQWNLINAGENGGIPGADISASKAWDVTTGSKEVVVAVIDTGVDYTHPDLSANMWRNEADCNDNGLDDDGNGYPDDCHGIDTFNIRHCTDGRQ